METKTIESTAVWVHIGSGIGAGMARWARGAARKGNRDGKRALSAVLFDGEEISNAIGENRLISAELALRRDAAYGDGAVSVCVAPAKIGSMGETYMSREQCLALAMRQLHKCHITQGTEVIFPIPGATLIEIGRGNVNAFLLYQEEDGAPGYCRMSDRATLLLHVAADGDTTAWGAPVWTRTVSAGDVISDEIRSHTADLRELEFYINQRLRLHGLAEMSPGSYGAFASWAADVRALQQAANRFLDVEERTVEWTEPTAGGLPSAGIIEELRGVLRGQEEGTTAVSGRTTTQILTSATAAYSLTHRDRWTAQDTLKAGRYKTSRQWWDQGQPRTTTVWETSVCCWVFGQTVPQEAVSAEVEIALKASEAARPHITLYGVIAAQDPETAAYNEVFGTMAIGEADVDVGSVARIRLTAQALNALRGGQITGAGIRYDSPYVEVAGQAQLILGGDA